MTQLILSKHGSLQITTDSSLNQVVDNKKKKWRAFESWNGIESQVVFYRMYHAKEGKPYKNNNNIFVQNLQKHVKQKHHY